MAISAGEESIIKKLNRLYQEGSQARARISEGWKDAIEVMKGNVWPARRPKYKVNAVMNFLAEIIERKAGLLTDSRPSIMVVSRKEIDDPLCEILQKTIEGILDERNFEQKLLEFVMLEEYFGFAAFNTCFDKNLDYGDGDIDLVVVDPRSFIFDPFVTRSWNLQYGEYCCFESIQPTDLLISKYGRKEDIKPNFNEIDLKQDSLASKIRQFFGYDKTSSNLSQSVIPRSLVRDWWVKDRQSKDGDNLKFPTWRHLIEAGGCIVEDGANPYIDGNHPFDGMDWTFNVDSAYGRNEIDYLKSPQVMFNKVLAAILENAILMGNGIWIGDRDALTKEEWERLTNEPGSIIKIKPGRVLKRDTPPALPNYMINTCELLTQGMEKLSGITEVTEGRRPGQVTSGVAIESLAIMAQTTLRLKARQLEGMLQRIGQKLISRIFAYYTTDRVFNLVGPDAEIKSFLFEREKIRTQIKKLGGIPEALKTYQFKVVPTSSLAMTQWQKGLMATQLFQLGLIDEEAALDALNFPGRKQIMSRMKEKKMEEVGLMNEAASIEGDLKGEGGGGFGRKKTPQRMPANLLRGTPHKETGMQYPTKQ